MNTKKTCLLIMTGILILSMACHQSEEPKEKAMIQTQTLKTHEQTSTYNSTYKVVAEACDWGAASTKAIIELNGAIEATDVCRIRVTESNKTGAVGEREVTAVYLCDESGIEINESSRYLAIEMSVNPSRGGLFYYDLSCFYNVWDENYRLQIEPIDPKNDVLKNVSVNPQYTDRISPQADLFSKSEFSYQETTMNYALYTPTNGGGKKPLIVWLHGQGEGGNDVTIALLGNKATALAGDEIQGILGGAYVLVPQCPTYWPESSVDAKDFGRRPDGTSRYEELLLALINDVVASQSGIDTDRIYIGGCSMGGYMTMLMTKNHPDLFAAAFPVCEFYEDRFVTDKDVKSLVKMPLWLTYCLADQSVPPQGYSQATIDRLQKAGAKNLHVSIFEDVHDTSGKYLTEDAAPYLYQGHSVWIYVFNNECVEGDLGLWEWLALQHK